MKSGIFSNVVLLPGESRREYAALATGLRDCFPPQDAFDELLVDKLAMLVWRQRRLVRVETGKIAQAVREQVVDSFKKFMSDRDKPRFGKGAEDPSRLFSQTSGTDILAIATSTLQSLRDNLATKGWESINVSTVWSLFATEEERRKEEEDKPIPRSIYETLKLFAMVAKFAKEGDEKIKNLPSPEALKSVILEVLDSEIAYLDVQKLIFDRFNSGKRLAEFAGALVLPKEIVDSFVRCESHLSREFERTLNQLERHQRMRSGQSVPPAIKVELSA